MRAALFHEFGGIDKIVVEDIETPKPAPNEVLIKVGACALNHLDVDFREGISRFPPRCLEIDAFQLFSLCDVVLPSTLCSKWNPPLL
jgi:NADPH:quinone reductase-like Zn-dependent oxidoreductase